MTIITVQRHGKKAAPLRQHKRVDPVSVELIRNSLVAATEEMKSVLMRTSYNMIIYEALDFTVGLFNSAGETLSIGLGLPTFIRGMSDVVKAKVAHWGLEGIHPGDILLTNDAYTTGAHLNHLTFSIPVFHKGRIVAFSTCMAHWQDIGGILNGMTTDIFSEGLQIPLVKYHVRGRLNAEMRNLILMNVRRPDREFDVGNGIKRRGKRLLTVGTDCSVGKMFTTLALEKEMRARKMKADFRATGQTGIFIAGRGVSIDAVVSDFISGAVEWLAPESDADHWDLIEGQGSLFHASYAGVTLGLIHGSQADALVVCHEHGRAHMRGLPGYKHPSLEDCIARNIEAGQLTNPKVKCVGIAINTQRLGEKDAIKLLKKTEDKLGLPTVDPLRTGVAAIVDVLR